LGREYSREFTPTPKEIKDSMSKLRKETSISHEELQEAIRKFQGRGGIIQKLPDQVPYNQKEVGSRFGNVDASSKPDTTA
jgi:hypothetical protein